MMLMLDGKIMGYIVSSDLATRVNGANANSKLTFGAQRNDAINPFDGEIYYQDDRFRT